MNEKERAALQEYLDQHPINHLGDIDTLVGELYWWHTQYNPVEDEAVKEIFASVEAWIHELARDEAEKDVYMNLVNKTCSEYERAAYVKGIKVGMRLVAEMMTE